MNRKSHSVFLVLLLLVTFSGFSKTIVYDFNNEKAFSLTITDTLTLRKANVPITVVAEKDEMREIVMLFVEGGTFKMGCTSEQKSCVDDEKPAVEVTVGSFMMSETEVTVAQYYKFVTATGYKPAGNWSGDWCGDDLEECNYPVVNVNWEDAVAFCKWAGARLPTEAEWEYAARGGFYNSGGKFEFAGGKLDDVAWYMDNSNDVLHEVAKKQPNELGFYDMSGNVWEWCQDWYEADYYSKRQGKSPAGPASGTSRTLRGGGWDSYSSFCRVSYRAKFIPTDYGTNRGFRLASEVK